MEIWFLPLLLCVAAAAVIASVLCPDSCTCVGNTEARCTSLQFTKKKPNNHIQHLSKLDVSNAGIIKMSYNLKAFPNLKHLNLSWNKMQHVSTHFLPESLETLDISHNYIKYFPRNLHSLPKLKEVFFEGNPIHCDCDSASDFWVLQKNDVVVHSPKCAGPNKHKGDFLHSIKCRDDLFGSMQGDAPYEGSGFEATTEEEIEREYIIPDITTAPEEATEPPKAVEEEGSGTGIDTQTPEEYDDGSSSTTDEYDYDNVTDLIEPVIKQANESKLGSIFVKPCNFDCSTPFPIDNTNDTSESPSPNLVDGLLIIANDLGIIDDGKNDSDTQTTSEFDEVTTEPYNKTASAVVTEPGVNLNEKSGKVTTAETESSNTSYIFFGLFLLLIVGGVAYVWYKRSKTRRHNRAPQTNGEDKTEPMEEVELLTKPPADDGHQNGRPEAVPFINGSKPNEDDDNHINSVKEPEPKNEDDVELRKPPRKNVSLSFDTKRVTIKAGEIPNSTPKTPVLVTRHLNSDGDIVTIPNVDQDV